ncbi:Sugar lactone lactonase YvrE [Tistlia consotensis]|uniref:Gluconolactonase n=1 Tax=Tistlia consotensis USBA 355 TaxID=560819 RepID=A0A1Y6BHV3_9PROT|nr:SMP-30/gluconolactonase/LRE family protein [Tistlia consotensis]SMF12333.1 gluconolactonase [Tistlia consotensis USBA 355]SNR51196.1 Sugar lactone lactonase YvrE [Tistlia consotensis]
MLRIETFVAERDSLGEGPLWDPAEERFYWIDSYGPALHRCDLKGGDRRTWSLPEPIGSFALREKGGAVLALRSGFHFLDLDSGAVTRIVETQPGELRPRLNDGKVDRQGRFLAGSMDFQEADPIGKLFRLDPDLSCHVLDEGIICSNGPCFSPDGRTLYFADSSAAAIYAYDYDTASGAVRSRRLFASFEARQGFPDGATVDSEGFLWSVEVYAGRLVRFDPEGVVDRVVGLPVFSTTSITFGGPNLDIAFVTSMARPHDGVRHKEREAGMVFAVHGLGVTGLPEPRFAG